MFQYAAACGLAHEREAHVLMDVSAFESYALRAYELSRLCLPQDIHTDSSEHLRNGWALNAPFIRRLMRRGTQREGAYREPHFHFDKNFFALSGDEITLDGYFQSPLYFTGCEGVLRERFRPAEPLGTAAQGWSDHIGASRRSVSLHVRRGDYVSNPDTAAVHTTLGDGYYRRATELMRRILGEEVDFFLFSDAPDFVEQAFADLPRSRVVRTDPARSWEDMFLMARCHHHIIANSSYSWWGAWLNPSPDKIVIAPGQWFTSEKLATTNVMDLYPEGWIILK
ncbi:alpha-1,2-fucosyltransferase [Bosea sp. MMO-172]|uniref:alpha-1,2-fucosyltransferase n=1 Tax=Bosea sp. MMO-172 TaxID=3127885 RepID=UPI0030163DA2